MKYNFRVERKVLKLIGATIRTFDGNGNVILRAEQKGFKLKEQISFYADEEKTRLQFSIKARNVIDIAAKYDITLADGTHIGYMKRKGISSSFVRDEWHCFDAQDNMIAMVQEDSALLGVLRRFVDFVSLLAPQKYTINVNGEALGHLQQNYNILVAKFQCEVDERLTQHMSWDYIYAVPSMLAIIDNKQG